MTNAEVCISVDSQHFYSKVVIDSSESVVRSDGGNKNSSRSYLKETGYFDLDLPRNNLGQTCKGHFQKPLNLKPKYERMVLEGAVRVRA